MTGLAELISEVEDLIERLLSEGKAVSAARVAHDLIEQHAASIDGGGKGWFLRRAYNDVRQAVRLAARRYAPDGNETAPQLAFSLPGFNRLQKAYLIKRDGEEHFVPIEQLTTAEIATKVAELRLMAVGCSKHAAELARYSDLRGTMAGAA